jgi:hypothetical protein
LLLLSNLTINFNKSLDYFRLGSFVNLFVLILIYDSGYPVVYLPLAAILLAAPWYKIYQTQMPHPSYPKLSYHKKLWILHTQSEREFKFEKIKIRLDTGFFMLISLYGISRRKNIVVFYDQITSDERRRLHMIEKIN